jgi:hypothetical protein
VPHELLAAGRAVEEDADRIRSFKCRCLGGGGKYCQKACDCYDQINQRRSALTVLSAGL